MDCGSFGPQSVMGHNARVDLDWERDPKVVHVAALLLGTSGGPVASALSSLMA